jgi:methylamine dehydrogenase heavy chain
MRVTVSTVVCLLIVSASVRADIAAETITTSAMATPQPSWFIVYAWGRSAYIFDADDGQMQGLVSVSNYTPALQPNLARREFYAVESFYSRGDRGERTDILTIFDMATLTQKSEVAIPQKSESSIYRRHIGLLGNNRHVAILNMTPGQSVSIVDIEKQEFIGEIATPGCSTIMPVETNSFLLICGDGTLQLIRLDDDGKEANRSRSDVFFSVNNDPIGDTPVATDSGWLFQSYGGIIYEASVDGDRVEITASWSLLDPSDVAEGWRIGSDEPMAHNHEHGLLYTLMHVGTLDERDEPATEVWVFDRQQQRRLVRLELETPVHNIMVTQESAPKLLLLDEEAAVSVYDAIRLKKLRKIDEVGSYAGTLQGF